MTWRRVPLKRVASIHVSNVDKKSVDGQPPVRLCNYTDVYYRDSIEPSQDFMRATASPEQIAAFVLKPGDVVITKDSEAADDIGVPAFVEAGAPDLVCGYHLALIRPRPEVINGRYLFRVMESSMMRSQLEVAATGITRFGLRADAIGEAALNVPPLPAQRAIADFLDAETARIDALIDKKGRMRDLLKEEFAAHVERIVWGGARAVTPLMHLTPSRRQIMYGIVLPGPNVEDGVPIVKGGNVASGRLEPHHLARTAREIEANYARSRVAAGDVLYAIRGGIGDVAIASEDVAGANITQDVARVAPRTGVDSRWIRYALESATAQADALSRVVGATVRGINIWDLKRVRVPRIEAPEMRSQANTLMAIEQTTDAIRRRLDRQTQLLAEHRRSLITAAVTGELEVRGAAA